MKPVDYQKLIKVTDNHNLLKLIDRMSDIPRQLHYLLGLGSEVGELHDAVKKYLCNGKPVDKINILEECGDLLWYIGNLLSCYGFTFEEAMDANIAKLDVRYPNGFKERARANTNTDNEYKQMKESLSKSSTPRGKV